MIEIKSFCTPEECRVYANMLARERGLVVDYHYYMDNLNQVKIAGSYYEDGVLKSSTVFNNKKFGITPDTIKRLSGKLAWNNEIRFYLKQKNTSVIYTFKLKENTNKEIKTAVLQNRESLFSYLKEIINYAHVGIISCHLKSAEDNSVTYISDLTFLPQEGYQIHNNDKDRAASKLELNFYLPLSNRYLNLKLKRVQESA